MVRLWLKTLVLVLFLGAGVSKAGEQVLLLSEPGSGAHAFVSLLAAKSRFVNDDDIIVVWDPCAVVRRQRAAVATSKEGVASAGLAFTARECSLLVQRVLECNSTVDDISTIVTSMRLALINPTQRSAAYKLSEFVNHKQYQEAHQLFQASCLSAPIRLVKEGKYLSSELLLRQQTLVLHYLRDPRDLVLGRLRASGGKMPSFQVEKMKRDSRIPVESSRLDATKESVYESTSASHSAINTHRRKDFMGNGTSPSISSHLNKGPVKGTPNHPVIVDSSSLSGSHAHKYKEDRQDNGPYRDPDYIGKPFSGVISTGVVGTESDMPSKNITRRRLQGVLATDSQHSHVRNWPEMAVVRHARAVCAQQRLTLQGLAPVHRDGKTRGFWLDRKYLSITAESFELEPDLQLMKVIAWMKGNWNKHSQLLYAARVLQSAKKQSLEVDKMVSGRRLLIQNSEGPRLAMPRKAIKARDGLEGLGEWRHVFDSNALELINSECSAVIDALRYPTQRWQVSRLFTALTPGDVSSSRKVLRKHQQYPDQAVASYSDDRCGQLWLPIHGLGGQGGTSLNCRTIIGESAPSSTSSASSKPSTMSLSVCAKLLKESNTCHAATYLPPKVSTSAATSPTTLFGACILHDRGPSSDFSVKPHRGVVHLVKSSTLPQDSCVGSSPSSPTPFNQLPISPKSNGLTPVPISPGALGTLEVMSYTAFGNLSLSKAALSSGPQAKHGEKNKDKYFYLAMDTKEYPGLGDWRELMRCYELENGGIGAWEDEDRPDLVQNMAHLYIYESLLKHPLRTTDYSKASLVVLPIETVVSSKLRKPCFSTTHAERLSDITQSLIKFMENHDSDFSASKFVSGNQADATSMYQGTTMMVIGTYWATFRDWGGRKLRKNEMESESFASSAASARNLLKANRGSLWTLLANHAILVTIDEYFSHDWRKVIVAPYLAHADITKSLLVNDKEFHSGQHDTGFKATHSAGGLEYKDGRTIQVYFRGGVDHGSMCKRRRVVDSEPTDQPTSPRRKRSQSEITAFVNKGNDGSVTWLREAAVDYFRNAPPGVSFVATGDRNVVFTRRQLLSNSTTTTQPTNAYARLDYVSQLMKSRFCLHLQGDTTTSRRLFDAIAAGCIPVIIADNVNLPFSQKIDYSKFSIIVPEIEILSGKSSVMDSIMRRKQHPEEISEMQYQLSLVKHELLYGAGEPSKVNSFNVYHKAESGVGSNNASLDSNYETVFFKSRTIDHILQEAIEVSSLPIASRYRRFKPAFSKCLDLSITS